MNAVSRSVVDRAELRDRALEAGLAIAARSTGITFVTLPAPVAPASALVDAWRVEPVVSWTSPELTIVGIGIAHELRGVGPERWDQVVAGARALVIGGAVVAGEPAPLGALGLARPRFVGGAAFAPGAADAAPWRGFGDAWFALPRWTYVHDGVRGSLVLAVDASDARDAPRWHGELVRHRAAIGGRPADERHRPGGHGATSQPPLVEVRREAADAWRAQIAAISSAIASGACSKIVAARACTVALAGPVRAAELLATLDERHADCVRVLVRPPGAGALVAATPERLIRRDGDVVQCDALAGTATARTTAHDLGTAREPQGAPDQPRANSARIDPEGAPDAPLAGSEALLASAKDRWEHDLVVRAIRDALEDAGAIVDAPGQPSVRALRHVLHLHTPFRATLRAPRHLLELAGRLHPTPAVGGTPTRFAVDWIRSREPVARGWYASPVGWFDLDGNGELAVAIRSGVVVGDRAHLWAGAGIVAGSDPDRELAETESKLRAMLGALGAAR